MGRLGAEGMKEASGELGFTLETQLEWHLTGNHYPPVPVSMVKPCVEAIVAVQDGDEGKLILMPEGISWRGSRFAPASAIVEGHHLETWCYDEDLPQECYE